MSYNPTSEAEEAKDTFVFSAVSQPYQPVWICSCVSAEARMYCIGCFLGG